MPHSSFNIRFDGCGALRICARTRAHALQLAQDLERRGRTNIVISAQKDICLTAHALRPED